jgi:4'-phosphopantetheinyl transferase
MKRRAMKRLSSECRWIAPPAEISMREREIHVWSARLDRGSEDLGHLWATLSREERSRAMSFYFSRHRERFIAARGILRNVLARYLRLSAHEVRFSYGASGKPALAGPSETADLCFNLSHADDLAIYAVGRSAKVGIDLERIRPELAEGAMAESFFLPTELSEFEALPRKAQVESFFANWTAREAYVKARGDGLSEGPSKFEILQNSNEEVPTLLDPSGAAWSLYRWKVERHYLAALVVPKGHWRLRFWQWGLGPTSDLGYMRDNSIERYGYAQHSS